jgi:hypothetical protein
MSQTALGLNTATAIYSGLGLGFSANLTRAVQNYANLTTVKISTLTYTTANSIPNSNIGNLVANIAAGTNGSWLVNTYPSYLARPQGMYNTGDFANAVIRQGQSAFTGNLGGFAINFNTCVAYINQVSNYVSTYTLLANKTYQSSGPGIRNQADLATNGLGAVAGTVAKILINMGTMFTPVKLDLLGDPYQFGKNLLAQGLGSYGNLSQKLAALGLNIYDLTTVPSGVTGSSEAALLEVYKSITGADLDKIIQATGYVTVAADRVRTLADVLILSTVADAPSISVLGAQSVTSIKSLGQYLAVRLPNATFTSCATLSSFMSQISVPVLPYVDKITTANTTIISSNVKAKVSNLIYGSSGPLGDLLIQDMLGSAAGLPYTAKIANVTATYSGVANTLDPLLNNLNNLYTAVTNYAGNLDGWDSVNNNVAAVTAAITSLSTGAYGIRFKAIQAEYDACAVNYLNEINNLALANIKLTNPTVLPTSVETLASGIADYAKDPQHIGLKDFFSNIATNDASGDLVRATMAESINAQLFASYGIDMDNTVNPVLVKMDAARSGLSLSDYLKRNL